MRQRQQQDLVMALWFAELEAKSWLGDRPQRPDFTAAATAQRGTTSPSRRVMNLNELAALREAEQRGQREAVTVWRADHEPGPWTSGTGSGTATRRCGGSGSSAPATSHMVAPGHFSEDWPQSDGREHG
jgi:hypothetical protein